MTHITTSITMDTTWITAATTMLALHVLLSFVRLWQSRSCTVIRYQMFNHHQPSSTIINHHQMFLWAAFFVLQAPPKCDISRYRGLWAWRLWWQTALCLSPWVWCGSQQPQLSRWRCACFLASIFMVFCSLRVSWIEQTHWCLNYHLFSDPLLRSLTYNLRFINRTWLISKDADQTKSR